MALGPHRRGWHGKGEAWSRRSGCAGCIASFRPSSTVSRTAANVLIATLFFLGDFQIVHAADDTFSCIEQFDGPTVRFEGDLGYTDYRDDSPDTNTVFDARGATWKRKVNPQTKEPIGDQYTWMLLIGGSYRKDGAPGGCWAGGRVVGTNDPNSPRDIHKHARGSALTWNVQNGVVDGIRVDNVGEDGVGFSNSDGSILRNSWISRVYDDCIESDRLAAIALEDSLIEKCYMGVSTDPAGKGGDWGRQNEVMTYNGVLMSTREQITDSDGDTDWGTWWKIQNDPDGGMGTKIYNSVFAFGDFTKSTGSGSNLRTARAMDRIVDCKNNIIAWTSDEPFPSNFQTPPSCFTILKGQEARDFWNAARQNWINCHPKVARVPGDPESEPSQCDENAYGGGGTAMPLSEAQKRGVRDRGRTSWPCRRAGTRCCSPRSWGWLPTACCAAPRRCWGTSSGCSASSWSPVGSASSVCSASRESPLPWS